MKELSNVPSKMLKQSLEDLEAIENNPNYRIDMGDWHVPVGQKVCEVCHAGAVMANRLKADKNKGISPSQYAYDIGGKLRAINEIRKSCFDLFFYYLKIERPYSIPDYYSDNINDMVNLSHKEDLTEYKEHICTIIGILESEGL